MRVERRDFLRYGLAVAAGSILSPVSARKASADGNINNGEITGSDEFNHRTDDHEVDTAAERGELEKIIRILEGVFGRPHRNIR